MARIVISLLFLVFSTVRVTGSGESSASASASPSTGVRTPSTTVASGSSMEMTAVPDSSTISSISPACTPATDATATLSAAMAEQALVRSTTTPSLSCSSPSSASASSSSDPTGSALSSGAVASVLVDAGTLWRDNRLDPLISPACTPATDATATLSAAMAEQALVRSTTTPSLSCSSPSSASASSSSDPIGSALSSGTVASMLADVGRLWRDNRLDPSRSSAFTQHFRYSQLPAGFSALQAEAAAQQAAARPPRPMIRPQMSADEARLLASFDRRNTSSIGEDFVKRELKSRLEQRLEQRKKEKPEE